VLISNAATAVSMDALSANVPAPPVNTVVLNSVIAGVVLKVNGPTPEGPTRIAAWESGATKHAISARKVCFIRLKEGFGDQDCGDAPGSAADVVSARIVVAFI
jgi:hypothetical protein